jgi:hypothetical protein
MQKDEDRGKIRNREFAQQLKDFSGLRFGKITPTDIDGFMDFGDNVFIFIETKHGTAPLPYGQKLALARLCDASVVAGKASVVLIAHHQDPGDIDVANLPVDEIRMSGKWRKPKKAMNVREAIESFLEWHKP